MAKDEVRFYLLNRVESNADNNKKRSASKIERNIELSHQNVGRTQTKDMYRAPTKVILDSIFSIYSEVFFPGLIPGI